MVVWTAAAQADQLATSTGTTTLVCSSDLQVESVPGEAGFVPPEVEVVLFFPEGLACGLPAFTLTLASDVDGVVPVTLESLDGAAVRVVPDHPPSAGRLWLEVDVPGVGARVFEWFVVEGAPIEAPTGLTLGEPGFGAVCRGGSARVVASPEGPGEGLVLAEVTVDGIPGGLRSVATVGRDDVSLNLPVPPGQHDVCVTVQVVDAAGEVTAEDEVCGATHTCPPLTFDPSLCDSAGGRGAGAAALVALLAARRRRRAGVPRAQ